MDRFDQIRRQLTSTFQAELEDHLNTLNRGILALEKEPEPEARREILVEIFRAAHTLKGAARAIDMKEIESLSHRLEDTFVFIRSGSFKIEARHINILLELLDTIRAAMDAFLRGETLPGERLVNLYDKMAVLFQSTEPSAVLPSSEIQVNETISVPNSMIKTDPVEPPNEDTDDTILNSNNNSPANLHSNIIIDETIRVSTAKLDLLMDNLGELMVTRMKIDRALEQTETITKRTILWQKKWQTYQSNYRHLRQQKEQAAGKESQQAIEFMDNHSAEMKMTINELNKLVRRLKNDRNQLRNVTDSLENDIHKLRLLPLTALFDIFPRMVRDLCHQQQKEADLFLEGADVEIDRQILELIKDPLIHLLRNAVDHGIESPEIRLQNGKSRQGTIRLKAEQRGASLTLEISDDGQGINIERVKQAALNAGFITLKGLAKLNEQETLNLIFHPGLSTSSFVSDISGRGIGMDIVHTNLEKLHGVIHIDTVVGQGTSFKLVAPLNFSTSQVLLTRAGGEILALPMLNVERILNFNVDKIGSLDGKPAISINGRALPITSLANLLKLPESEKRLNPGAKIPVIILNGLEKQIALQVDQFLSTDDVVVKTLGRQLRRVKNITGVTQLGDGQLVMILNVNDLIKSFQDIPSNSTGALIKIQKMQKRHIMVVDDSVTTRLLEKHILENAAYSVTGLANGQEALDYIRNRPGLDIDLVVSDINMPLMDGFMLTRALKNDPLFSHLPVILVTSLESAQDKLNGLEAGADAYVVKRSFDQKELLATIDRLIG